MATKTPNPQSSSDASSSSDDEQTTGTQPPPRTPIRRQEEEEESEADGEAESEDGDGKEPDSVSESESESESYSESEESDSQKETATLVTPIVKAKGPSRFYRIWSFDDEITLLDTLLRFQSENGCLKLTVAAIGGEFHDAVKEKLSFNFTCSQVEDKLRTLKRKYLTLASRAENDKTFKFTSPHDETVFELSKKIWVSDGPPQDGGEETIGSLNSKEKFPFLKEAVESMGKRGANEWFEMMDPAKARTLNKRRKSQKVADMKLRMDELDLYKATLKLMMEGIASAQ